MTKPDLVALAEYNERQCNRHVNGFCSTARCMKRGGFKPGDDMNVATCEEHETAQALRHLASQPSSYEAGRDELEKACRDILPYLRWTIGPESPGYHPTMPSAVAAFEAALSAPVEAPVALAKDWKTVEEQIANAQGDDFLALLRDYLTINSQPGDDLAPLYIARIDALLATERPLPSVDEVAQIVATNCFDPKVLDSNRKPFWKKSDWRSAELAATAILTLLGGSAR